MEVKAPKMPSATRTETNCNARSVDERADSESVLAHRHRQQQVGFHEPKLAESTVYANNETPDDSIHSQLSSAAATALTAATAATATMPSSSSSSSTLLLQPPTSLGRILNTTQQENTQHSQHSHLSDTYFMLQAPKMVPWWDFIPKMEADGSPSHTYRRPTGCTANNSLEFNGIQLFKSEHAHAALENKLTIVQLLQK